MRPTGNLALKGFSYGQSWTLVFLLFLAFFAFFALCLPAFFALCSSRCLCPVAGDQVSQSSVTFEEVNGVDAVTAQDVGTDHRQYLVGVAVAPMGPQGQVIVETFVEAKAMEKTDDQPHPGVGRESAFFIFDLVLERRAPLMYHQDHLVGVSFGRLP